MPSTTLPSSSWRCCTRTLSPRHPCTRLPPVHRRPRRRPVPLYVDNPHGGAHPFPLGGVEARHAFLVRRHCFSACHGHTNRGGLVVWAQDQRQTTSKWDRPRRGQRTRTPPCPGGRAAEQLRFPHYGVWSRVFHCRRVGLDRANEGTPRLLVVVFRKGVATDPCRRAATRWCPFLRHLPRPSLTPALLLSPLPPPPFPSLSAGHYRHGQAAAAPAEAAVPPRRGARCGGRGGCRGTAVGL